ncbi:MAG: aminocarboxymuconate-semialdehyde decarboxylase [Actinomycetota bacterium]|nr:aminocarboxymuconate-semialdehyde decarboxylase [Actinomycetota bacterium]
MRIDVHGHLLPADLPERRAPGGDARWPALVATPEGGRRLEPGGRVVDDHYWSVARRTEVLDGLGIDVQVLSPLPALLPWWAEAGDARDWCRAVNEATAAAVSAGRGRFLGLGIVPTQDTDLAAAELDRIKELGLVGVEIGTAVDGQRSFADASVDAFLVACAEADLPILLHPNRPNPCGTTHPALDSGIWATSDTALVMGERLFRHPGAPAGLRVCLAHGGGSLVWQWSRVATSTGRGAELPEWISVDTAGCTCRQVDYLVDVVGPDRVLLGTDLPAGRRPAIAALLEGLDTSPAGEAICAHNPSAAFVKVAVR